MQDANANWICRLDRCVEVIVPAPPTPAVAFGSPNSGDSTLEELGAELQLARLEKSKLDNRGALCAEAVLLHAEFDHRMTRLYEEVLTRLEEMAMITARNLSIDSNAVFEVVFTPVAAPTLGIARPSKWSGDLPRPAATTSSGVSAFSTEPWNTLRIARRNMIVRGMG